MTFDQWWAALQVQADLYGFKLPGEKRQYFDYYEDGDDPLDVLRSEIRQTQIEVRH